MIGGNIITYPNAQIGNIPSAEIYKSVRYDMSAYRFPCKNGDYRVTIQCCEVHYTQPKKRVFGIKVEDKVVEDKLDVFAKVGKDKPFDVVCKTEVKDGRLDIDFIKETEFPCVAGIVVEGPDGTRKINCGGEALDGYEADLQTLRAHPLADDFYADWAHSEFGPEAAPDVAALFSLVDGLLPRPSNWIGGPGGFDADPKPWTNVQPEYAFVDDLAAMRAKVKGAGNLERFDYWWNNFAFLRATGHMRCAMNEFNVAMEKAKKASDPAAKKQIARDETLPKRIALIKIIEEAYGYLLATISTYGEMGTVCNFEQHMIPVVLDAPGKELADLLGEPLPQEALLRKTYAGAARVIVPTQRGLLRTGEAFELKVILLDKAPAQSATLCWRAMGAKTFNRHAMQVLGRQTYVARLSKNETASKDLEYYAEMTAADGKKMNWPVTAPEVNQTVIRMP